MAFNDRLFVLLQKLDPSELDDIWEMLGSRPTDEDFDKRSTAEKVEPVSKRLRSVASHSIRSLLRGDHEREWKAILVQIAEKIGIKDARTSTEEQLELSLWRQLDPDDADSHRRLADRAARNAHLDWITLGSFGSLARVLQGPSYRKLVPVVLYIIDRVQLCERTDTSEGV